MNQHLTNDQCMMFKSHARVSRFIQTRTIIKCNCENFINIVSDSTLKQTFNKPPLVDFWCSVNREYLQLSEKATKLPFQPHII